MDDITLNQLTPRAQTCLLLAGNEAHRLQAAFIGTEHLLLGMTLLGQGNAYAALEKNGITVKRLRAVTARLVSPQPGYDPSAALQLTPRAKYVLTRARKTAAGLNHGFVGTEHILLALIEQPEGTVISVLKNLGVEPPKLKQDLFEILGETPAEPTPTADEFAALHAEIMKGMSGIYSQYRHLYYVEESHFFIIPAVLAEAMMDSLGDTEDKLLCQWVLSEEKLLMILAERAAQKTAALQDYMI